MNLSTSIYFGILFLLKASFALSAPHSSYPVVDEDEEALIDKLASLAAAVGGPDAFLTSAAEAAAKQQYPRLPYREQQPQQNYDFSNYLSPESSYRGDPSPPSDFGGLGVPDNILMRRPSQEFPQQQDLPSLKLGPRQFGYKPNDIRFYLPAEEFPAAAAVPLPQEQEEQEVVSPSKNEGLPPPPPQRVPVLPQPQIPHPQISQQGQHEFVLGDDKSDFYFMKKKELQQQQSPPSPFRSNFPAGPSHIMTSDHSANYPGFISQSQIPQEKTFTYSDMYYIAIVAGCSAAGVVGIIAAGICYYRIHERIKAAADVDYPAYGVTGPSKDLTPGGTCGGVGGIGGDRKLAQSAQMYHYQHQKQQMAALQKGAIQGNDRQGSGGSDVESEDDNEEDGDYTVYECPGLAPAGEMEVKNPLFNDDREPGSAPTPATPSTQQTTPTPTPKRKSSTKKEPAPPPPQPQQQQSEPEDKEEEMMTPTGGPSSPSGEISTSSSGSSTATVTLSTPKEPEEKKVKAGKEKTGKEGKK